MTGPEPLPEFGSEINGIIAEIAQLQFVTKREITDAAGLIRKASDKQIKFQPSITMVCRALGYLDFQDANASNRGVPIVNRNFGHKDLATLGSEISNEEMVQQKAIEELILPWVEKIRSVPCPPGFDGKNRSREEREWFDRVKDIADEFGATTKEDFFILSFVLLNTYRKQATSSVRKGITRIPGFRGSSVREVVRRLIP
ncbi:hypothetical protein D3C72_1725380 [compost metagenome]